MYEGDDPINEYFQSRGTVEFFFNGSLIGQASYTRGALIVGFRLG